MQPMSKEADQAIDEYITQLKKAGPDQYLFWVNGKQNELSLNSFMHGDALYLGNTRILSASFQYALIEKLQKEFIDTHPYKLASIFTSIDVMTSGNFRGGGFGWSINNTMISDPDRKYAQLAADSALRMKNKEPNFGNALWFNFLHQNPDPAQFHKYQKDLLECIKQRIKVDDLNYNTAEKYAIEYAENNPVLYRFLDTMYRYDYVEKNIPWNQNAVTCNWHDIVKEKCPSFYAEKEKEKELLHKQFPTSAYSEIPKPLPYLLKFYKRTEDNDETVIQKSRDILLSDPFGSLDIILQKAQQDAEGRKFIADKLAPVLCARAEFLAEMKGNFAYHAMNYFYSARYHEINVFTSHEEDELEMANQGEDILYQIYQSSIEYGEKFIDMDIAAIKAQTELLKSKPA